MPRIDMKILTIIILGLLVVGCGKGNERKLTAEEQKIVGTYELKQGEDTAKMVFPASGIVEGYKNGTKEAESKWMIADGGLHFIDDNGDSVVIRINKDSSITLISAIADGKRAVSPKDKQTTFIKIK